MTTPWPPPLLVHHPRAPLWVDASAAGVDVDVISALPWARAFSEMEALEAGAVANPDEDRQVGHYWLRAPEHAPTMGQARAIGETVEAIRRFAIEVREGTVRAADGEPFERVVHIGIGGSVLPPQLLVAALDEGAGLPVDFIDNTDPDGIQRLFDRLGDDLRHTLVSVASKSGGTAETKNGLVLAREALARAGVPPEAHLVAITSEGSALHREAADWLARFAMWDFVGGRTAATAAPGLLPAALAGLDTHALLEGARHMDEWTRTPDWQANPAAVLAGVWHAVGNGKGDRAMVLLPYSDRLTLMVPFLQQLVMESIGKRHDLAGRLVEQGLTVYGFKGSSAQHAFVQQLRDGRDDFFATFVQILDDGRGSSTEVAPDVTAGDFLQGFLLGTRRALSERGRPIVVLTLPRLDAYGVGALIALFERAVGLYGSLLGLNPYHQPGVEAGKRAAADLLDLSRRLRRAADAPKTAEQLAAELDADVVEVFYLAEHLVATGRLARVGDPPLGRYTRPQG